MKFDYRARINGLFNKIEDLKNTRKIDLETIKKYEEDIMNTLKIGQEVIVYKNDEPHILKVVTKESTKFDRAELADDLGVSQTDLNIPGVAEMTEKQEINSAKLEEYWKEESEEKIKVKKATQQDVERLTQLSIADFLE